jgi:Putative zinc-finger
MTVESDHATAGTEIDHLSIASGHVAERYVTGRLSPEDAARFEEHYLDCAECCTRVEDAERLQRGLRRLAEEAAERTPLAGSPFRAQRLALAAAALVAVALLPAAFERGELRRLQQDLAATRGALAHPRSAPEGAGDRNPDSRRLAALDRDLQAARRGLAAEAERRATAERQLADERQPRANLPLLSIAPLRTAGGPAGDGPVHTLTLPRQAGWIALWIEPGGDEYPAYRATLIDGAGRPALAVSHLLPNDLGALLITVHSTALAPGSYRLVVDGLPQSGKPAPVARAALRIVPAAG